MSYARTRGGVDSVPAVTTLGIIANPAAGTDVRRALANATSTALADKVSIVRRVVLGAAEAGVTTFLFLQEPHGIWRRATDALGLEVRCEPVERRPTYTAADTIETVAAMRERGCGAVVAVGGDGTSRAVALGWADVPLVALSTGTNNVFPRMLEPTIAGMAAGLVATGAVPLQRVSRRAKVVRVTITGAGDDLAVVDAVATHERLLGNLRLFRPETFIAGVYARAEPASIGLSAIGGLLHPCPPEADGGVVVRFGAGPTARALRAPLAPGHYETVPVASAGPLALGEAVTVDGPCLLALDGERLRAVPAGATATMRVGRDGPRVIDVHATLAAAADAGTFETTS